MAGLTDKQQAGLVIIGFILVPIGTWMGLGFPTDRTALGLLGSQIVAGIVLAIKEAWGVQISTSVGPNPKS